MRKMTKGLVLILLLTMLLSTVAMAAGSTDSLIISAGEVSAEPGGTVTVPVSVTKNPGIVAVKLQITYDTDVLTLQTENGVVDKNLLSGANFVPNATVPGVVTVMFEKGTNEDEDITATGALMDLNFAVSDEAAAGDYTIAVKVQEARNFEVEEVVVTGQNGKVTVQAVEPAAPQIDNLTGSTPTATVTAPASGWSDGANTFTVSNMVDGKDVPCMVLVKKADGSYIRLTAATSDNNTYSFTTPDGFVLKSDVVVVVTKGDANGDGKANMADTVLINRANVSTDHAAYFALSSVNLVLLDLNADGKVNMADAVLINRANVSVDHAAYAALTW